MAGPSRVEVSRGQDGTPQIATRTPTYGAIVGITEMGPIGSAFADVDVRDPVTSWAEWTSIYGSWTANAQDTPNAVKAFFDEGGQYLYTSRVVHVATPGDPTTKTSAAATLDLDTAIVAASAGFILGTQVGPFDLEPADALVVAIDGVNQTATFNATAAYRDSVAGPFALSNNDTLLVTLNGTPVTVTFTTSMFVAIGTATAAEVVAAINARLASLNPSVRAVASVSAGAVRISTTWRGTGASINVTGGTSNAVLQFTTGNLNGGGNVADIDAVTVAELESIIETAQPAAEVTNVGGAVQIASTTTGPGSSVQIVSVGSTASAVTELGLDNALHAGGAAGALPTLTVDARWDGTYANRLSIRVSAASSGASDRFDIAVIRDGRAVESWRDASLDTADANYVEALVNRGTSTQKASQLIRVTDLFAAYPSPSNLPAVGTFGPMAGGDDGLAGLVDSDFYGSQSANGATGLYAFNSIARIDLVAVPGRCTAAVHNQTITWCEVYREGRTFAVLAVPSGLSVAQARTYVTSTASLKELSEIAAMYGPWILIDNPLRSVFGTDATVLSPPEGAIMGMMARLDSSKEGGAFEHPSNKLGRLRTARGVERDDYEDPVKRGLAFDDLINSIRAQRGKPIYVDGARCLKSSGPFPTVGQSRGVMLVTNNLVEVYDDERNAGIRESLYVRLAATAQVYLGKLAKASCFRSNVPAEAFFVDFGPGLNTPDVVEARQVLGTIGLATALPAEFIFVTIESFAGLEARFQQAVRAASTSGNSI